MTDHCPLCRIDACTLMHSSTAQNHYREFFLCSQCDMVHVPVRFHLTQVREKARYLEHNNNPEDVRYRSFLGRVWDPLKTKLTPGSGGLDFGSGPTPVLAGMIEQDGFAISVYDPFFAPAVDVLTHSYDLNNITRASNFIHLFIFYC